MKSFKDFSETHALINEAGGSDFSHDHGKMLGDLYKKIREVEKASFELRKFTAPLKKALSGYEPAGDSKYKMDKLLDAAEDPSEIMSNANALLQRLQEQSGKLNKK